MLNASDADEILLGTHEQRAFYFFYRKSKESFFEILLEVNTYIF